MMHGERAAGRAGFTVVEMALSATVLFVVIGLVASAVDAASRAFEQGRLRDQLATRASRALERVVGELAEARRGNLVPEPLAPLGASVLTYQRSEGWSGGANLWSAERRIGVRLADGELDDGLDNDGNGLVDDRVLYWMLDPDGPGEREVVWCTGVAELLEGELPNLADDNGNGLDDEQGLSLSIEGDLLTVRLTLEAAADGGAVVRKTVETSVSLRN